jgi:hypothetical protein
VTQRMTGDLIEVPGDSFHVIKALIGYRADIQRQIKKYPFEKNVFLMMRFRSENKALSDFIIETLSGAGLKGVRADQPEWNITGNVYNPIAVLYCCKYGIALFDEAETNQAYNPNVIYELGIMHCLRRECLILRNDSLPAIPFDLIKDLYMPYKGELAVRTNIQLWLKKITPESVKPRAHIKAGEKSELEYAAVTSQVDKTALVVGCPDEIAATDFSWQVTSGEKKAWKVPWNIKLTNNGPRAITVKVQVLFLDENGFALDDHTGLKTRAISPGETYLYKATAMMSPDLAERIRRAMATILTTT